MGRTIRARAPLSNEPSRMMNYEDEITEIERTSFADYARTLGLSAGGASSRGKSPRRTETQMKCTIIGRWAAVMSQRVLGGTTIQTSSA